MTRFTAAAAALALLLVLPATAMEFDLVNRCVRWRAGGRFQRKYPQTLQPQPRTL